MAILKKMNSVRVPYFKEKLREYGSNDVLDVGCGGGYVSEELALEGFDVTGVDISNNSLALAAQHAHSIEREVPLKLVYKFGSALQLPFPDNTFDAVVASDVFEHLTELPRALSEIHRVLKPGGLLVFDTIAKTYWSFLAIWLVAQEMTGVVHAGAHDYRLFINPSDLGVLLAAAGFSKANHAAWEGIGAVISPLRSLWHWSKYEVIESFYRDLNDLSGSYMGCAVKGDGAV
jgi:ubiquinone biosynthesis O-methyltransferase